MASISGPEKISFARKPIPGEKAPSYLLTPEARKELAAKKGNEPNNVSTWTLAKNGTKYANFINNIFNPTSANPIAKTTTEFAGAATSSTQTTFPTQTPTTGKLDALQYALLGGNRQQTISDRGFTKLNESLTDYFFPFDPSRTLGIYPLGCEIHPNFLFCCFTYSDFSDCTLT